MPRLLPLWLLGLAALGGCGDFVVIGYKCADGIRDCADGSAGDSSLDSGDAGEGSGDGNGDDGNGGDAESGPKDAGADTAPSDAEPDDAADGDVFLPLVRNRSFELTAGSPGDLDDTTTGTTIDPWRRCPNLFPPLEGVSVISSGGLLGQLSATEGDTFLRLSYVVPARLPFLTQRLQTPWPARERRALTFDVAGQSVFNELRLAVLGSDGECPASDMRRTLTSEEIPQTGRWERDVCVEIEPDEDVQWLTLHAESSVPPIGVDAGGLTAQVYIDNLRESARCP